MESLPKKRGPKSSLPDALPLMEHYIHDNGWSELGHAIPTVEGLSSYVGCSRQNVYLWADANEEVKELLNELSTLQGCILVNKGLLKEFDSPIVRLMLGQHGYSEKASVDHSSKDGTMTPQHPVYKIVRE